MNVNQINPLVLAYLGDAVYELYVREYLINQNICKVNELQNRAVCFVSAKAQASSLNYLMENGELTDEEINVIKRARNTKSHSHPKNIDILTYKHGTALEALIGYLYLTDKNRLESIIKMIVRG